MGEGRRFVRGRPSRLWRCRCQGRAPSGKGNTGPASIEAGPAFVPGAASSTSVAQWCRGADGMSRLNDPGTLLSEIRTSLPDSAETFRDCSHQLWSDHPTAIGTLTAARAAERHRRSMWLSRVRSKSACEHASWCFRQRWTTRRAGTGVTVGCDGPPSPGRPKTLVHDCRHAGTDRDRRRSPPSSRLSSALVRRGQASRRHRPRRPAGERPRRMASAGAPLDLP